MNLLITRVRIIGAGLALTVSLVTCSLLGQQKECSSSSRVFLAARKDAASQLVSGRLEEALASMKRAFSICPDDFDNARELALASIEQGDTSYAENLLRELVKRQDYPELHSLLGRALTKDKDFQGAATQYQAAATMELTEIRVFEFGTSLMKINFGAATEVLQYGVDTYPSSVKMHVALALAFYAQDRSEEGARLLCAASELDPADVLPMEVLADTKIVPKSSQPEAERRLNELRLHHPGDGLLLFDYAMVKSGRWSGDKTARLPELTALLQKSLTLDPKLAKAHSELALVYEQEGNYLGEIAELKQAVRLTPDQEQFHYRLAFAYRATGDLPHSKEELARYKLLHLSAETSH